MKERFIGWVAATFIRAIGLTLRFSLDDRSGVTKKRPDGPMIWAFWHNALFAVPLAWHRYIPERRGSVLTSASKDGEVLAAALRAFGADAVRGSSRKKGSASKRAVAALLQLIDCIRKGADVAITPDGPRGPRCKLQPGIVKLAEKTGAPILPIRVDYHNACTLKTWDGFRIPIPFSKVDVVFEELQIVEKSASEEDFERARARLETLLIGGAPAAGEEL